MMENKYIVLSSYIDDDSNRIYNHGFYNSKSDAIQKLYEIGEMYRELDLDAYCWIEVPDCKNYLNR